MVFLDGLEVGVLHGVLGGDALGMIVSQHLRQHVDGLFRHEVLILAGDEFMPGFLGVLADHIIVLLVKCDIVLFDVGEELVCAEDLGDLDELIVVVLALEEWLLLEDHAREHATQGPDVEGVVIGLQIYQ